MKPYKSYKKDKIAIIISFLLFTTFVSGYIFLLSIDFECFEDNYCKQGTETIINNNKIVVSENTCLENNGIWISSNKRCDFRNYHHAK